MAFEIPFATISTLGAAYRQRSLSPVEVTAKLLDRIARIDPLLNSFITVLRDQSLAQAEQAEGELKSGHDRGPLHGVPVAVKDLMEVAGAPTTYASRAGSGRVATSDAKLVQNLKQAGAVILGKTNLLEYAYGAVHPDFGQTNNPRDTKRTSGGSSGGSAAAVAAGLCFAAVGTDTGGSIRIPASYCGVAGLKPTFDLVSLDGVHALSPSLDHAGPMARCCADAALLLGGMTGQTFNVSPRKLAGIRIGMLHHPDAARFMEPAISALFDQAVEALRRAGAVLQRIELPSLELANHELIKITWPEASLLHRQLLAKEPLGYSAITRTQLEAGFSVPAVDYLSALQTGRRLRAGFEHVFQTVDAIVTPSVPWVAPIEDPPIGGAEGEGEMLFSGVFNLTGLPALSVPCGLTGEGLPGGMQIITPWHRDELALAIGAAIEKLIPTPDLSAQFPATGYR